MADLADFVLKGGVGIFGVVASAYTLTKFIISTPVKIGDRGDAEQDMDIVLCFDTKTFPQPAVDFFVRRVKEQEDLVITIHPAKKTTVATGDEASMEKEKEHSPEEEVHWVVGATKEGLGRIKARKEKATHAEIVEQTKDMPYSSGERIDLVMFELHRLAVVAPATSELGEIPAPFEEDEQLFAQALHSRLVKDYFPLHDDSERHELVESWVKKWHDAQPLNAIHNYFGDEIGFYFAFLDMYTRWLVVPAAAGLVVFGLETFSNNGAYGRASYSLLITSWATAFLKFWKRRESSLRNEWGITWVTGELSMDHPRPEFKGERRYDPVEDKHFTYFSSIKRMQRYLATSTVTLAVLGVILQLMFMYFRAEKWVTDLVTEEKGWDGYYQYLSLAPSVIYSVVVLLLDMKYRDLAAYLTDYENHRTEAEYANALVLKLASFYFVNNFGSLFFLAFVVRDMDLLQQTLSSLLITRQLIGNVQEQLVPYFTATSSLKTEAGMIAKETHVQEAVLSKVDAELLFPTYDGTFDDYLELFVQFGQVTLFASAYPLAALWCLANNVMEIRSDGFKLCVSFRRSRRVPTQGIGTWQYAFNTLGYMSVMTNCAIFGLHSGLLDKLYPSLSLTGVVVAVAIMEHVMMAIKVCIEMFVPDVPTTVVEAQRMERAALRKKAMLRVELAARKQRLESEDGPIVSEGFVKATMSESDRLHAATPQQTMEWMRQEKERRLKLEQEVKNLNNLYMGWIREEQSKRKAAEQQLADLRVSAESMKDAVTAKTQ